MGLLAMNSLSFYLSEMAFIFVCLFFMIYLFESKVAVTEKKRERE